MMCLCNLKLINAREVHTCVDTCTERKSVNWSTSNQLLTTKTAISTADKGDPTLILSPLLLKFHFDLLTRISPNRDLCTVQLPEERGAHAFHVFTMCSSRQLSSITVLSEITFYNKWFASFFFPTQGSPLRLLLWLYDLNMATPY